MAVDEIVRVRKGMEAEATAREREKMAYERKLTEMKDRAEVERRR
jgi:hypothetical protein